MPLAPIGNCHGVVHTQLPRFARTRDVVHAASADRRMLRRSSRRPAGDASSARTWARCDGLHADPHAAFLRDLGDLDRAHRRTGGVAHALHPRLRDDQQETQLLAERLELLAELVLANTSTSASSVPPIGARRRAAFPAPARPPPSAAMNMFQSIASSRDLRQRMPGLEEHGLAALARHEAPDLVRGERQDRREPAHHALGDVEQRGLRRAARARSSSAWCTADP